MAQVLTQRTHFCLGLRLLYLRGLRRHVGEGNLDRVLDAVQQLDDHVRHHLERGSVLARRVAHHGVAHLKSNEIIYRQLRMISVFLETISLKRILKLHSYIEALEDGSLLSPRRGDDEEAVDSLQIGRVVGCFLPLRQIQSCQKPRSKRFLGLPLPTHLLPESRPRLELVFAAQMVGRRFRHVDPSGKRKMDK